MHHPEDVYCSTTEFKANLKRYKELAQSCVVHITEHGRAGYVFTSIEVYEQRKAERIHEAKWQVWAEGACFRGTHDTSKWFDLQQEVTIEYLGQTWDDHVARSFDDDVRKWELSDEQFSIVKQCMARLAVNPQAGLPFEVGPEAYLPSGIQVRRLNAGAYDIIYGLDEAGEVQAYGLIKAL